MTLEAAVAAKLEVTFVGACLCERAEPAADLAALLALGFCKILDAAVAALFPVVSFFAIALYLRFLFVFLQQAYWRRIFYNNDCYSH